MVRARLKRILLAVGLCLALAVYLVSYLTIGPAPYGSNLRRLQQIIWPVPTTLSTLPPTQEKNVADEKIESIVPRVKRLWFMEGGGSRPTSPSSGRRHVWPDESPGDDRISQQLMYLPSGYRDGPVKRILLYNGLSSWGSVRPGIGAFADCPVDRCTLTVNRNDSTKAAAILYRDDFSHPGHPKLPRQVWILYMLESPYHIQRMKFYDVFNWTATYRWDSDIVTPYGKWVYYDDSVKQFPRAIRNFAANKTKKVAWFVSNCGARNSRMEYAKELQQHIDVDIYGNCGTKKCPRSSQEQCFKMLEQQYKFYLAFENSNCFDYITEKLFINGLKSNILPVVMGGRKRDYEKASPYHSYIHVDDFANPKELALYLHKLDQDDDLYNEYFRWKGTGELINTFFFCRLCAMLHDEYSNKWYTDINKWWRGPGTCTLGSWNSTSWNSIRYLQKYVF